MKNPAVSSCQVIAFAVCSYHDPLSPWQTLNSSAAAILKIANGVTNSAANLIPATVPRPVAKLSVVGVCGILALWLFGKVRSAMVPDIRAEINMGVNIC